MADTVVITQEDLTRSQQNIKDNLKDAISNGNSSLKNDINNLGDRVIKRLQGENQNLRENCNKPEVKKLKLEIYQNFLTQYRRKINTVISRIPDSIDDKDLENTVIFMISDINVNIEENGIEACHRFGKPDVRSKSKNKLFLLSTGKVAIINEKTCQIK